MASSSREGDLAGTVSFEEPVAESRERTTETPRPEGVDDATWERFRE